MKLQGDEVGSRETKRLFFEDAYQREFEAVVLDRYRFDGKPALVLDRTCFYPESGGQPSDRGQINGVPVVDVFEDGVRIVHVLETDVAEDKVRGVIDWPRRFDHMQQHSGQHILSQSFFELMRGETCAFHLGEAVSTLEIGLKHIPAAEVEKVEARANAILFEDREIKTYFVPPEKVNSVPLRRPPKKEGLIRVVEVDGYDYSACGGTHCRRTGEVGLIKIVQWEKIRGNLRFEFLCGGRALRDYAWKNRTLGEMAARLSTQSQELPAALERNMAEAKKLRKRIRQLEERLAAYEAQEIIRETRGRVIASFWRDKTPEELRRLALNLIRAGQFVVLLASPGEERVHLIFACSENFGLDMRDLIPVIFSRARGKGGGSPSLVEIVVEEVEDVDRLLRLASEAVGKKLSPTQ